MAARLFSGLSESIQTGQWKPTGVPAIYKLLEGMKDDPTIELHTVLTVKDRFGPWAGKSQSLTFGEIGDVSVLPWRSRSILQNLGIDGLFRELGHLARLIWLTLRWRPDICYVTNANFVFAALCERLRLAPVIMRFLGIHPVQKELARKKSGLQWRLYQSRFDHAVCSMDGSGAASYLPDLLNKDVPLSIILNGVDKPVAEADRVASLRTELALDDRPVVLFVGRLEKNKGIFEFVDAVNRVLAHDADALTAIVVGTGSEEPAARSMARTQRIHFVGPVPHRTVAAYLELADIYVSLNFFGSLSNANLEAAVAGKCIIALEPDPETATDVESLDVFPTGTFVRIPRENLVEGLVDTLCGLFADRKLIDRHKNAVKDAAEQKLLSWDARVAQEIELIKNTAR